MPVFMDLHHVPGISAQGVAEAHRQDVLIQKDFNCTCLTYWIDEARDSVFCLIEAPDANAVHELHNKAHGLTPHQIIQVNYRIVESFLGRIYDPEIHEIKEGNLKVFNDPAFRILVLIKCTNPIILQKRIGVNAAVELYNSFGKTVERKSGEFNCEITEHHEPVNTILSFTSSSEAVKFALAIQGSFSHLEKKNLKLQISITAGVPVANSSRIFGETLDLGKMLLYVSKPDIIGVTSELKDVLYQDPGNDKKIICKLSAAEEKLLKQIFRIVELNIDNENFGIDDFSAEMALSRSGLNRAVQLLTGRSPNALVKEYRLNKALDLLAERNLTVSEISFTTGFRSPSYFSKCFKEHFDISPSAFL